MKLGAAARSLALSDRTLLRRTSLQDLGQVMSFQNLTMHQPQKAASLVKINSALISAGGVNNRFRVLARNSRSSPTLQTAMEKCKIVWLRYCAQVGLPSSNASPRKKRVVTRISIITW